MVVISARSNSFIVFPMRAIWLSWIIGCYKADFMDLLSPTCTIIDGDGLQSGADSQTESFHDRRSEQERGGFPPARVQVEPGDDLIIVLRQALVMQHSTEAQTRCLAEAMPIERIDIVRHRIPFRFCPLFGETTSCSIL